MKRFLAALCLLSGVVYAADFLAPGYFSNVVSGGSIVTTDKYTATGSHATTVTPPYGFRDAVQVELLSGDPARGAASFSETRIYTGGGTSDHIHAFQALQGQINLDGDLSYYRAFAGGVPVTGKGTIDSYEIFSARNPGGLGPITRLVGLYVPPLNRGTIDNYAVLTEGSTPSLFGGQVRTKSALVVNKDGSDNIAQGPYIQLANTTGDRVWLLQLNANNDLDLWNYNGSSWAIVMTFKR